MSAHVSARVAAVLLVAASMLSAQPRYACDPTVYADGSPAPCLSRADDARLRLVTSV